MGYWNSNGPIGIPMMDLIATRKSGEWWHSGGGGGIDSLCSGSNYNSFGSAQA